MRTRFAWRGSIPGATRCCRPIVPIMATPAARSPLPATGAGCRMSSPAATFTSSTPYLYRSEFNAATEEEECQRALAHLRRIIECEGPTAIAAILLESIPGTAGILVPPAGYMQGVRALADEFGIVLILDEVMAGFGRTGSWFAFEQDGVVPDLVTFAKG